MTKIPLENVLLRTSFLLILFRAVHSQLNCSSHTECDSCTAEGNPQCGWCVVENKCSSQTQCQNSTLNTTVRWTQNSTSCITAIVRPHQLVLDSQVHKLTVSLNSPGLPAPLAGESFLCHLEDSEGRFSPVVVPAVEITPQTKYGCDTRGLVHDLSEISAVINLSFMSSLFNTSFGITEAALTIYKCSEGSSCSECLQDNSPCGWCHLNKECSSTSSSCRSDSYFVQRSSGISCISPIVFFSPISGPVEGGTIITVVGADLRMTFSDLEAATITLGGVPCINPKYISGEQFECMTTDFGTPGYKEFYLEKGMYNSSGSPHSFLAVEPTITSIFPRYGPLPEPPVFIVRGTDLNVGNEQETRVIFQLNGGSIPCDIIRGKFETNEIRCVINQDGDLILNSPAQYYDSGKFETNEIRCVINQDGDLILNSPALVVVNIDAATVSNRSVVFTTPEVTSVNPNIISSCGGNTLTFSGKDLDSADLSITLGRNVTSLHCPGVNSSALQCVTPELINYFTDFLEYSLTLYGASKPTITSTTLRIRVQPKPYINYLRYKVMTNNINGSATIRLRGRYFNSLPLEQVTVTVGGEECLINQTDNYLITCTTPDISSNITCAAEIRVMVGNNSCVSRDLDYCFYYSRYGTVISTVYLFLLAIGGIICILVWLCIVNVLVCKLLNKTRKSIDLQPQCHLKLQPVTNEYQASTSVGQRAIRSQIEEVMKCIPDSIKILSPQLHLSRTPFSQGEFGVVYTGALTDWNEVPIQAVAVKTLKGLFNSFDVQSLISEIVKMKELNHPHVMTLIGVCLDAGPGVSIVMPFMANGNLLEYLKRERTTLELSDDSKNELILAVRKLLLRMCHHIALGMAYLAKQKLVHRDLAARNCMLDSNGAIKVGDFGLAEDVYASGYFRQRERADVKLPFKWMAIESLNDAIFTEKTDVWSYGVTMWEIFSGGRTPYPAMSPMSLVQWLRDGNRLERPNNAACDSEIIVVMCDCWRVDPDRRPAFSELASLMERHLESIAEYTELRMVLPEPTDDKLVYDYVTVPTNATCGPLAFGEETLPPPSEDPMVTTNTAFAVSMEEGIVAPNSEETPPL